ncbi:unnamed protein product, partial [Polarella glacialis]
MGGGVGKAKYGKDAKGKEKEKDQSYVGFDHNGWRTPKARPIPGMATPGTASTPLINYVAPAWSPRQGGQSKKASEKQQEKAALQQSSSKEDLSCASPKKGHADAVGSSMSSAWGTPGSIEALQDGSLPPSPMADRAFPKIMGLPSADQESSLDVAELLEDADKLWKQLLAKRSAVRAKNTGSNMAALFTASQLKETVETAARAANEAQSKHAIASSSVEDAIKAIDDLCHSFEAASIKNLGVAAMWRPGDFAVRVGGLGLCEVVRARPKSDIEVCMTVSGGTAVVEPRSLVPLLRSQEPLMRKAVQEFRHSRSEQHRLEQEATTAVKELKKTQQVLIEEMEKELAVLEADPEFALPGAVPFCTDLIVDWSSQDPSAKIPIPSYPKMEGLISAAEMMLKYQATHAAKSGQKNAATTGAGTGLSSLQSTGVVGRWVSHETDDGDIYYHNETTKETTWELPPGAQAITAAEAAIQASKESDDLSAEEAQAKSEEPTKDGNGDKLGSRPGGRDSPRPWRAPSLATPSWPPAPPGMRPATAASKVERPAASQNPPPTQPSASSSTDIPLQPLASLTSIGPHFTTSKATPGGTQTPPPGGRATPKRSLQPPPGGRATPRTDQQQASQQGSNNNNNNNSNNNNSNSNSFNNNAAPFPADPPCTAAGDTPDQQQQHQNQQKQPAQFVQQPGPQLDQFARFEQEQQQQEQEQQEQQQQQQYRRQPSTPSATFGPGPALGELPAAREEVAQPEVPVASPSVSKEVPETLWEAVQTDDGDTYFHNESTGETAWELPPGGKVAPQPDPESSV